ncbi:MAG: hypothetical protein K6G57_06145 [Lachnospiraceae bacterium]|nr:hypothetical protein [Lachnospiraceae bacterium]
MAKETVAEDFLYSDIAYDDAFRTMETECDDLLIPFLNYAFDEKYDNNSKIIRLRNEHFVEHEDKSEEKRITDSHFEVEHNGIIKKYHLECESKPYDSSIQIRIFEYDAQIALDNADNTNDCLKVHFPHTGILMLRSNSKTPNKTMIIIETPGGNISYEMPIIKVSDYNYDYIFERRLYLLIPFMIFNREKEMAEINASEKKISNLLDEYRDVFDRLRIAKNDGLLSSFSCGVIMNLTYKVLHKLTMKHKTIQQKVGDFMGGKVIDLPIIHEYHRGLDEGQASIISKLIENGNSEEDVSRLTGMPVDEIRRLIRKNTPSE